MSSLLWMDICLARSCNTIKLKYKTVISAHMAVFSISMSRTLPCPTCSKSLRQKIGTKSVFVNLPVPFIFQKRDILAFYFNRCHVPPVQIAHLWLLSRTFYVEILQLVPLTLKNRDSGAIKIEKCPVFLPDRFWDFLQKRQAENLTTNLVKVELLWLRTAAGRLVNI